MCPFNAKIAVQYLRQLKLQTSEFKCYLYLIIYLTHCKKIKYRKTIFQRKPSLIISFMIRTDGKNKTNSDLTTAT